MQTFIQFLANHPELSAALLVALILLCALEFIRLKRKTATLSPQQTIQMINHESAILVDIRSNPSFQKGHIVNALSISPEEIRANSKKLDKYKAKPIIIVDDIGMGSQKIAALLIKLGYTSYSLAGGMRAWDAANMPIVKK